MSSSWALELHVNVQSAVWSHCPIGWKGRKDPPAWRSAGQCAHARNMCMMSARADGAARDYGAHEPCVSVHECVSSRGRKQE